MSTRSAKLNPPPPPPTPMIFHLPRRSRTFRAGKLLAKATVAKEQSIGIPMLQDNCRFGGDVRRRKVGVSSSTGEIAGELPEERWRFQVDVLRAECNFLRLEREVALQKLERNRVEMESSFRSAVEIMISVREKLDGKGNVEMILDAEIEEMKVMLEKIQCGFRGRRYNGGSFGENFSRKASALRQQLQLMLGKTDKKQIQEVGEITEPASSLVAVTKKTDYGDQFLASDRQCQFSEAEKQSKKMEGLSNGMGDRVDEHGLHFRVSNNGMATAGGDISRSRRFHQAEELGLGKQIEVSSGCCCKCKELVEKIGEQVMAETKQWEEMQAMLKKVKVDMDDLRSSRDLWERRAISSELRFLSLQSQSREWKRKAIDLEIAEHFNWNARESESNSFPPPTLSDQLHSEICRLKQLKIIENQQKSMQAAKEKQVLECRFGDTKNDNGFPRRRSPLQETGNLPRNDSAARMFR